MEIDRRSRERVVVVPGKKVTSQEFDQLIDEFKALRERMRKEKIEIALKDKAYSLE